MYAGSNVPYKHSVAKYWLKRNGNEIYINGENFLGKYADFISTKFDIQDLDTEILLGEELIDIEEEDEITTISYKEMRQKFGLTVYRFNLKAIKVKKWFQGQQHLYIIAERRNGLAGELPDSTFRRRGMKLEWRIADKVIRGVGEGFGTPKGKYGIGNVTPWVIYEETKRGKNLHPYRRKTSYSDITERLIDKWQGKKVEKDEYRNIKELGVMITEEGYLLCMPKERVLPKILFVGKTRSGKSFGLNSLVGRIVYVYRDNIGLMNDALDQFYDLMLPQDKKEFIYTLERISNEPRPLPVINLYMSCPRVKVRYSNEHVGYRLVIPLKDFLYRYKFFTHRVKKWDLGSPEKYLRGDIVNAMDGCKTAKDVKNKLYALIPDAKDSKGVKSMIFKWESAFESIFRDKFTSNLFKDEETTSPYWKLRTKDGEEMSGHPFIIAMEAGLVPVINNHLAKNYPIAEKQIADLMRKVVEWQMERGEKRRKRVWIVIDELKDLSKKKVDLFEALDYVFTQGAFNLIGFIGNIQEYTLLSPSMKANASHLIIFNLQTNDERSAIAKDYNLDRDLVDSIADMKKHQCLFTTKERVILYTPDGARKVAEDGGIWRGKMLPPLSVHKSP